MEVFTAATLSTLILKVTSVVKYLTSGHFREAVTQLVPWIGGTVAVLLAAQADVSQSMVVWGTMTLGDLDFWSQILAGVSLGSGASVVYDLKKAVDNTDSASEPPLEKAA